MVAYNANNVGAYSPQASGGVLAGPTTATLPTNLTDVPGSEFESLGYVTEDGVTEAVSRDSEKKKAWGGQIVKILSTDHEATWSFALMETANTAGLKAVYGEDNIIDDGTGQSLLKINADELPERSFIFDMLDKGSKIAKRIVIPRGRVTEIGDVVYTHADTTAFEVTIEAMEDTDGNKAYVYTASDADEDVTP